MPKVTKQLVMLVACNLFLYDRTFGQQPKRLVNRALDQNLCMMVNDGGVKTDRLCVEGSTGNIGMGGAAASPVSLFDLVSSGAGNTHLGMRDLAGGSFGIVMEGTGVSSEASFQYSSGGVATTESFAIPNFGAQAGVVKFTRTGSGTAPNLQVGPVGGVGIWSPGTNIVAFGHAGQEKARLHSNGFWGFIDENAPDKELHIKSAHPSLRMEATTNAHVWDIEVSETIGKAFSIRDVTNSRTELLLSDTGDMTYGNTTNVGLRTFKIQSDPANRPQIHLETGAGGNDLRLDVGGTADVYTDAAISLNIRSNGITVFQAESNGVADVRNDSTVGSATVNWCTNSSSTDVLAVMRTCTSSKRYKHNINDLPAGISDKIYDLRPVAFDNNGTNLPDYGLIAEEVDLHLPVLVGKDQEGRPENVNYRHMVSLLIAEMKKLKGRIEKLEEPSGYR